MRRVDRAKPVLVALLLLLGTTAASVATMPPADADLREVLSSKLEALPWNEGNVLRTAVRGGQVLLQGEVRLLEHSLRAEQLVWQTPGVVDVDNEIRVVPVGAQGDRGIEREVRLIIKGEPRFLDTNLAVGVLDGVVSLRGLFQDPADVLALKHRVASVPGVLHVVIDAHIVASRGFGGGDGNG